MERREKLKTKWAQLEAVVGSENRVKQIAEDIVAHFEQRLGGHRGQGDDRLHEQAHLHRPLQGAGSRLRPGWHDNDDDKGSRQGGDDRLCL